MTTLESMMSGHTMLAAIAQAMKDGHTGSRLGAARAFRSLPGPAGFPTGAFVRIAKPTTMSGAPEWGGYLEAFVGEVCQVIGGCPGTSDAVYVGAVCKNGNELVDMKLQTAWLTVIDRKDAESKIAILEIAEQWTGRIMIKDLYNIARFTFSPVGFALYGSLCRYTSPTGVTHNGIVLFPVTSASKVETVCLFGVAPVCWTDNVPVRELTRLTAVDFWAMSYAERTDLIAAHGFAYHKFVLRGIHSENKLYTTFEGLTGLLGMPFKAIVVEAAKTEDETADETTNTEDETVADTAVKTEDATVAETAVKTEDETALMTEDQPVAAIVAQAPSKKRRAEE